MGTRSNQLFSKVKPLRDKVCVSPVGKHLRPVNAGSGGRNLIWYVKDGDNKTQLWPQVYSQYGECVFLPTNLLTLSLH